MKLFRKTLLFVTFLLIFENGFSKEATISIEYEKLKDKIVTRKLFGSFIEFLQHYVNGSRGMWAQELDDRSFDLPDSNLWVVSERWKILGDLNDSQNLWLLSEDRYNLNGNYSQLLQTFSDNEMGIYQYIYLNDSVTHTFYIYHKGNDGQKLYFSLKDSLDNLKFIDSITTQNNKWQKSIIKIPVIKGLKYAKLILSIKHKGMILLDEASLMPDNNINGIRKEVFDLYYQWKPGILRYPGGSYADLLQNKLEHCIGDIDQRQSSNATWDRTIQRMDFGLHEFMWFCDTIGMEPHITLNLANSSPEEAANYVEYCNGDTTTEYGKLRAKNGHPEPFNVKYFEIGNEQWDYDSIYSLIYLDFYDSIKAVDPNLKAIIDGNHWLGYDNFHTLFSTVGEKCDIYGYHPAINVLADEHPPDSVLINIACQGNLYEEVFFQQINEWIYDFGLENHLKQGLTEWWTNYGTMKDWILDSNVRNSSLESGLANASMLISMMKYSNTLELAERTHGLGLIRCEIDQTEKNRHFFGTPAYWVLNMLSNHFGQNVLKTEIQSEKYYLDWDNGFWTLPENSYLDGVVTVSKDSVYIALMNRYPDESLDVNINFNDKPVNSDAKVYYLWSENTLDANTYLAPTKVSTKQINTKINGKFTLLPHSFYIIAISLNQLMSVELNVESGLDIYPNPFSDKITISNPKLNIFSIEIFDLMGIRMYQSNANDNESIIIPTSDWPSGIYFLRIKSGNSVFMKNLIKL